MLNKRVCTLVALLLLLMPGYAAPDKDIKELGQVWVITVDKSGSMLTKTTPSLLGESVENRLLNGGALNKADFSKDRFLFYTSGVSFVVENGMGNELRRAEPFDKSFIHATDGKLHSFPDKKSCAAHIRRILEEKNYTHKLSFVSQIRLFSIVKAVNELKALGEQENYNQLMVLTITDDADQSDQWATDYRTLKQAAPNKLQQVNDSTAKYLYNSLNGKGLGSMECLYSEEKEIPHLWVYEYRTLISMVPEQDRKLFSVAAADGENISLKPLKDRIDGDEVCFYTLDSIRINRQFLSIRDTSPFTGHNTITGTYDNTLQKNQVTLWGHVQVRYLDPVLGMHFKTIPFVQQETVLSQKQKTLIIILSILVGLLAIGILAWLLIIRPRQKLFVIYSGLGSVTTVRRGFASSWKGNQIPIQSYEGEPGKFPFGCFSRKGRYISTSKFTTDTEVEADDVLILSHTPLLLSEAFTCQNVNEVRVAIDTGKNIESVSATHGDQYPPLLQQVYENTPFYRYYGKESILSRMAIWVLNRFGKLYFYHIPSITQAQKVYVCAHKVYPHKGFILDYHTTLKETEDPVVDAALTQYYSNKEYPQADFLVCCEMVFFQWRIIQLESSSFQAPSLRNVKNYIRFAQKDDTPPSELYPLFKAMLKKLYPKARICFVTCSLSSRQDFQFCVHNASAPGFISFVESTDEAKSQLLYSPFEDGDSTEKGIQLAPGLDSGHLYLSAIPLPLTGNKKSTLTKKLSNLLFHNSNTLYNMLKFDKDGFNFRGETIKYQ